MPSEHVSIDLFTLIILSTYGWTHLHLYSSLLEVFSAFYETAWSLQVVKLFPLLLKSMFCFSKIIQFFKVFIAKERQPCAQCSQTFSSSCFQHSWCGYHSPQNKTIPFQCLYQCPVSHSLFNFAGIAVFGISLQPICFCCRVFKTVLTVVFLFLPPSPWHHPPNQNDINY